MKTFCLSACLFASMLSPFGTLFAQSNYATPYVITTLAGNAPMGSVDGTGGAARFNSPNGVAIDGSGNLYVADTDNDTIRKVTPAGVVTTFAGNAGNSGSADGAGSAAQFNSPYGVAVDGSGNVYVSDTGNNTIRMITPAGVVTMLAGAATVAGSADDTGAAARFSSPNGVAVDGSGNVYVADTYNNTIRKITAGGVVTTLAGTAGSYGSADGTAGAARFTNPLGVAVDGSGNVYVADTGNNTIRKIAPGAVVTTLAGTAGAQGSADGTGNAARFYGPRAVAVDGSGNLFVADTDAVRKVTPAGVVTTFAALTGTSAAGEGLAVDASGNVFFSDGYFAVMRVSTAGAVTALAGATSGSMGYADGTGAAAQFAGPEDVAVDGSGNVYVADSANFAIRKVTPAGVVTTFAGKAGSSGSTDGAGAAARFSAPIGVAIDKSGNVYVADSGNHLIRKVTPSGSVTTLAGAVPDTFGATPVPVDGTGSAARFGDLWGIAVDGSGNAYATDDDTIRKITPGGVVTTLAGAAAVGGSADGAGSAARFNSPSNLAVDGSGNIYVADSDGTIRKVTPAGVVTTLAGTAGRFGSADGTGGAAQFSQTDGVAVDGSGMVYVTDDWGGRVRTGGCTVRRISPAGVVTTLAGKADVQGSADGAGIAARFGGAGGIAVDSSGNIYVADTLNGTIRKGVPDEAPYIQVAPVDQTVALGGTAVFSVAATGGAPLSYQWSLNGSAIPGATGAAYTLANAQLSGAGSYSVTVTNASGSATSSSANLNVAPGVSAARLVNISTRAQVGTGAGILIPGFVIVGSGVETLLIRADGPALAPFGVTGVLSQPSLGVFDSAGNLIASNTVWGSNVSPDQIAGVAASVGAFALAQGSADCALIVNLPAGAYTVQVSGVNSTTGIALAEVYEVSSSGTRLINISTRAQAGTGANIIIPGVVVAGAGAEQLLVRADGPALAQFGVSGGLAQPVLRVFDASGKVIASNTGWGNSSNPAVLASTAVAVGAFPLVAGSSDSAQLVSLPAGAYTIEVSGVADTTGIALAEVYEVPLAHID
jgi:hypothetical protein